MWHILLQYQEKNMNRWEICIQNAKDGNISQKKRKVLPYGYSSKQIFYFRLYHLGKRPLNPNPNGVKFHKSSQWAALTREFVQYIIDDQELVLQYQNFFRWTGTSDESFFASNYFFFKIPNTFLVLSRVFFLPPPPR